MGEASATLSSAETPLAPRLPLRLGRFTLCEELGAGGMATVYLARMELAAGLERLVALKTIHPHLAKEKPFVDMFLDEARIASHVTHPNVCSTHDFGELGGVYYLAMEYLLGEPLFDVINRIVERFDDLREVLPYLAARIIADACEGVHAAHSARGPDGEMLHIVHRDVSPQNLFLTYDGSVKVVDFGCAKAAERVAHTSTGVMKGKVGYAAPEQIKSGGVDSRADVWALGVCLWETLTLSPLFSRDTAVSTAMAVLEDEIELASDGRDWIPEEVARIADRALRRDLDDRYASARDLSRDLRRFIADSGFTLESAELAEWMDFLFEDRHADKIALAKRAQELDLDEVDSIPLYEVTEADVEEIEGEPEPLLAEPVDEEDDAIDFPDVSGAVRRAPAEAAPPPLERPKKRSRWPWVLLAIVLLGVAGYYLQLYYEPAPWFLELIGMTPVEPQPTPDDEGDPTAIEETPEADEATGEVDQPDGPTEEGSDEGDETETARSDPAESDPAEGDAAEGDSSGEGDSSEEGSSRRRRRRGGGSSVTTVVSGGGGGGGYQPQTPQEPTLPPPRTTGSLRVVAQGGGWAEVWAGNRRLGRTPVHVELPEGRHRLRILPWGREPALTETVTVESALEQTIPVEVGPEPQ